MDGQTVIILIGMFVAMLIVIAAMAVMLRLSQKDFAEEVKIYVDLAREEARELARTGGEARAGVGAAAVNGGESSALLAPAGLAPHPYPEINFVADGPTMSCDSRDPSVASWWRLDYWVRDWWFRSSIMVSNALRLWRQP